MILIISDRHDIHTLKVESFLKDVSIKYVKFNIDVESLKDTIVRLKGIEWEIDTPNSCFTTAEISVVWNRRTYVELLLEENDTLDAGFKIW